VPWSGAGLCAMIGFSVVMVVTASPVPALALTSLAGLRRACLCAFAQRLAKAAVPATKAYHPKDR